MLQIWFFIKLGVFLIKLASFQKTGKREIILNGKRGGQAC